MVLFDQNLTVAPFSKIEIHLMEPNFTQYSIFPWISPMKTSFDSTVSWLVLLASWTPLAEKKNPILGIVPFVLIWFAIDAIACWPIFLLAVRPFVFDGQKGKDRLRDNALMSQSRLALSSFPRTSLLVIACVRFSFVFLFSFVFFDQNEFRVFKTVRTVSQVG